jgi:hypothetical protein
MAAAASNCRSPGIPDMPSLLHSMDGWIKRMSKSRLEKQKTHSPLR